MRGLPVSTGPAAPPPPPRRGRPLTDAEAVLLAVAVGIGALTAEPVPILIAVAVLAAALVLRRPWILCLGALLLSSTLAARAVAGLRPAAARAFEGPVTLAGDPEPASGGVSVLVRADDRRFELLARQGAAGTVRRALAGEQLWVQGRIRPPPPDAPWLAARHVVGRLEAERAEFRGAGGPVWRGANALRRTLTRGAEVMGPERRSLFTGLVLGDRRDQSPGVTDDFRGSGLAHLLAVSGGNVAFTLALFGPLLRRLPLLSRWIATVAVIGGFALLTRFEPSVLRASAMAGLASTAMLLGRPSSSLRLLALAVAGLLLVDPLLVRSVGFQLSVGACTGLAVVGPALARALPGPRLVVEPLAVTLAAQLGVAPVQLAVFDGLPAASIPANLLAVPAAGLVMIWGLPAGAAAGWLGGPWAEWLHAPTGLLIGWVAGVARWAAALPLGELGPAEVAGAGVGLGAVALARARGRLRLAWVGAALAVVAFMVPAVRLRHPQDGHVAVASDAELWQQDGAVVAQVGGRADPERLLEGLRRHGVRRIDLLVLRGGGPRSADLAGSLRRRWAVITVLAPRKNQVAGSVTPPPGSTLTVGQLTVRVEEVAPRLDVEVTGIGSAGAPRARAPPLRRHPPSGGDGHPEPHA